MKHRVIKAYVLMTVIYETWTGRCTCSFREFFFAVVCLGSSAVADEYFDY